MTELAEKLGAFVILLSVLIFFHELGHFAVAKACGVRVLKFSIGFGNPIGFGRHRLLWRRGDTEYVIAWIPLGGFVKMLGEYPGDTEMEPLARAHPEQTLEARPMWQKLAIVLAGPLMNLLLPIALFAGMQAIGMQRAEARIGFVEPASPADRAGLRAGDRIAELDAEPVRWWSDLSEAIAARPGGALALGIERDGQARTLSLQLEARPGLDEFGAPAQLGWAGLSHARPAAWLAIRGPGTPAWERGLRPGDQVVSVAGARVEDWYAFEAALAGAAAGADLELEVQREVAGGAERKRFSLPGGATLQELGITRIAARVSDLSPDSAAEAAGLRPGDILLEYAGSPIHSFAEFAQRVNESEGRPQELLVARDGVEQRFTLAARRAQSANELGMPETRWLIGIRGLDGMVPGRFGLDRALDPRVAWPRAVELTLDFTHKTLVGFGMFFSGEVSPKTLAGPIGIAQLAGRSWQQGWEAYLHLMILISINLGLLNLLPIPVLDGGQATLFLLEGLRRSPLSQRVKLAVQQVGITLLVMLMGLAFWNDLARLWAELIDWLPKAL